MSKRRIIVMFVLLMTGGALIALNFTEAVHSDTPKDRFTNAGTGIYFTLVWVWYVALSYRDLRRAFAQTRATVHLVVEPQGGTGYDVVAVYDTVDAAWDHCEAANSRNGVHYTDLFSLRTWDRKVLSEFKPEQLDTED